jgi:hypothetical protein
VLRVAGLAVRTGASLAGRVLPFGGGGEPPQPERDEARRGEPPARRAPTAAGRAPAAAREPARGATPPVQEEPRREEPPAPPAWAESPPAPPGPEEPVSEEPVLVAEVADAGAEEGAGPEIEVAEPWPGYDRMKAAEVVTRLEQASPAELAVTQLHERANKHRRSVLEAAERRLARAD